MWLLVSEIGTHIKVAAGLTKCNCKKCKTCIWVFDLSKIWSWPITLLLLCKSTLSVQWRIRIYKQNKTMDLGMILRECSYAATAGYNVQLLSSGSQPWTNITIDVHMHF